MYFRYFVFTCISPWKRACFFISTNLNFLQPRILCANFNYNWTSGSGEDVQILSLSSVSSYLSPLGKEWGLSFEQTWIHFTQGCSVPSLVEIGSVVLEKKMKMWIVNDNVNHSDNDNGQWTHFDQKSSLDELKKIYWYFSLMTVLDKSFR